MVGGKLTPHLSLGTETVDKAAGMLGRTLPASRTAHTPLPGGVQDWPATARRLRGRLPFPQPVVDRLLAVYGARCADLLALIGQDAGQARLIGTGEGAVLVAEVSMAVQVEGAVRLADILHRRTMVGLYPALGLDIDREVAQVAAPLLGWSVVGGRLAGPGASDYVRTRLLGGVARRLPQDATAG